MKKWMIILASGLSMSMATIGKEVPPVGSTPKDFVLTATESMTLDNGLNVTFVPYGNTPKATLRLVTKTGNYDDNGQDNISDIAYDLLTEGTATRTALEIAQQAANMGGQIGTSVGANSSYVQIDVLSEFVSEAAGLVADVAVNSQISADDLNRVKTNFMRNIKVQKSQPGGQANEAFYQTIFGDHPYGKVFPDEAVFNEISAADVSAFIATNLVAKRSHLYVSGKFNLADAKSAVKKAFSSMSSGNSREVMEPKYAGQGEFVFVQRDNAPQSTLRIGLPVVDPSHKDYIGLQLMNTLLGGSFSSRITSNIREDKGYTYSPSSAVNTNVKSAVWFQGADVTAESTAASLFEILKEIKRLQTENPSAEELKGFQNYVAGIYVLQNSSRTAIINQLWFLESHGLALERLQTYVQKVNAVTPEELSRLASEYLTVDKMTLVIVGDGKTVTPQLAAEKALSNWIK